MNGHAQDNRRGILLMLTGVAVFSLGDAIGKQLTGQFPVDEILVITSLPALAVFLPGLLRQWPGWRAVPQPGLQLLRGALTIGVVVGFFLALARLPLADTLTLYLAAPVYVTALSALLLREKVGLVKWALVLLGFAGVLLALNPSGPMLSAGTAWALLSSISLAVSMIITRRLRRTPNALLTAIQFAAALLGGIALLPLGWVAPSGPGLGLLIGNGLCQAGGTALFNAALQTADASVVAPYQNSFILWAVLLGWAVFGTVPTAHVLLGGAVIITAGLLIWARERRGVSSAARAA